MRGVLSGILLAWSASPVAVATPPLPLLPQAQWMAVAPSAGRFASETAALLATAGEKSETLTVRHVGEQLRRSYGLPLVDGAGLRAAGIDLARPWLLFVDRSGAEYLAVSVADGRAFSAAMERWAAGRGLAFRDAQRVAGLGADAVTFSRAAGSRAAMGYLAAKGRAVILEEPAERAAGLAAAYAMVDYAPPVQPPFDGTLLVWLGTRAPLKDGWLAFRMLPDGVDLVGGARRAEPGWLLRDPHQADWIRQLTGSPEGIVGEPPAWARLLAGPRGIESMLGSLGQALGAGGFSARWLRTLGESGAGPVEAVARTLDFGALESGVTHGLQAELLRVVQPELFLLSRSGVTAEFAAMGPLVANSWGETLGIALAGDPPPAIPAPLFDSPSLACATGTPVAAARLSLRAIFERTKGIGLLDALTSDSAAGLYALGFEYGPLLRASRPALVLACEEPSGRLTVQGHWRIAGPP